MKKIVTLSLAAISSVAILTSCAPKEIPTIRGAFDYADPVKISERIDALGEITDTSKLSEIYHLIYDSKGLTPSEFASLENYEKVDEAFEATVDLYNEEDVKLKVMSFNSRNGEYGNGRMELLLSTIIEESPDLVGLQEAGDSWKPFLKENLPDEYIKLGHGRKALGHSEANYVLFKKDKFELLDSDTIWMTDTPHELSVWVDPETGDFGFPRIMTYALLKRKSDGAVFVFANTHLETDQPAQNHQAYWLTQFLTERFSEKYPIILTGDFNCTEGSPAYNIITDYGFEVTNTYGENKRTFTGYNDEGGNIIDFCFINEYVSAVSYKVMPEKINGQFVSDHNAIVAEVLVLPVVFE